MIDLNIERFHGDMEDYYGYGGTTILTHTPDHDQMRASIKRIYMGLGICGDIIATRLTSLMAANTFTKKGQYEMFLLGDRESSKVSLVVCATEIRGPNTLIINVPGLAYRPKWMGLLGYRVVKERR